MASYLILRASSVLTLNPDQPLAEAVVVSHTDGTVVAVGSLIELQSAYPEVMVHELGDAVLAPHATSGTAVIHVGAPANFLELRVVPDVLDAHEFASTETVLGVWVSGQRLDDNPASETGGANPGTPTMRSEP